MSSQFLTSQPDDAPAGGIPETPDRQPLGRGREDGATISERVGRDPGNVGDEVADAGDVTHPDPDPDGPQL